MALHADLVLHGGPVLTMDPERPEAEAVACRDGRIVHVGGEEAALALAGPATEVVDLEGATLLPGFADAHHHPVPWGVSLLRLDLRNVASLEELQKAVRQRAELTPEGGWVVGNWWDESRWPKPRYPTREDLDDVTTTHPVILQRVDLHMGVLNTRALEEVGLDPAKHPDGLLREQAWYDALEAVDPSPETKVTGLERAVRELHAMGVTGLHAIVDARDLRALQVLRRRGALGVRVTCYVRRETLAAVEGAGIQRGFGDPWLTVQGLKLFSDGSLGSRTARISRDYADAPGERGELVHAPDDLAELVARGHAADLQLAVHAIGDEAIDVVLDALEASGVPPEARPRIEHLELLRDDQVKRLRDRGVVASMQPNFIGEWGRPGGMYASRLGDDHVGRDNRLGVVRDAGVPIALGSDNMPTGPLYGLHWAVNGPGAGQRLTVEEALQGATTGPAFAAFQEHERGRLRPGFLADLVALAEDPRQAADRLEDVDVVLTVVDGEVVHRRGPSPRGRAPS